MAVRVSAMSRQVGRLSPGRTFGAPPATRSGVRAQRANRERRSPRLGRCATSTRQRRLVARISTSFAHSTPRASPRSQAWRSDTALTNTLCHRESDSFSVKASRYLTHVKRLRGVADRVKRMDERIEPASTGPEARGDPVATSTALRSRRRGARSPRWRKPLSTGQHAFEFRDPSWFAQAVDALLDRYDAALVVRPKKGGTTAWAPRQHRPLYGTTTLASNRVAIAQPSSLVLRACG